MTSATLSSTSKALFEKLLKLAPDSSASLACNPTNFLARLDLARKFRAVGVPVVIGGFHVSGCLSMLPEMPGDLKTALDIGVILFAGEGEGRMSALLRDIDEATEIDL